MKKMCIIVLCIIFMQVAVGCVTYNVYSFHPVQHPNSIWIAEKEEIYFLIGEDATKPINGFLVVENNEIKIEFHMGIYASIIEVCRISDFGEKIETIEMWQTKAVEKDAFTITVVESTYFQKNQQITFTRQSETQGDGSLC